MDTQALVSILRRISREPQFGKVHFGAFNMQEQRVLFRQHTRTGSTSRLSVRKSARVKLGTVDTHKLAQKHRDTEFLTELIQKGNARRGSSDALIFAGPKIMLDGSVPQDALKALIAGGPGLPGLLQ